MPQKTSKNGSSIWKATVNAFPLIEELAHLESWKWCRCSYWQGPLDRMSRKTHTPRTSHSGSDNAGFVHLQQIARRDLTQGTTRWLTWNEIGLNEAHASMYGRNTPHALSNSMVNLSDQKDTLIWSFNPSGNYSPKQGYMALILEHIEEPTPWWGTTL
jgi:hypothetical protein